ncbi:hypothetical protein [Nonomuraea longicatena]|uniref:Uncharacterized protein n=1 Tax=Nonomuraea longicatena TaxID=83682 RepID=A0ABN1NZG5_9ACTN
MSLRSAAVGRPAALVVGGLLLVAAAVVGGRLPSFAPLTYVVVASVGVLTVGAAFRPPPSRTAAREAVRPLWWVWAVPVAVFTVWELWALAARSPGLPTFSDLMDPVLVDPVWRGLVWAGWLLAGWGLVRR